MKFTKWMKHRKNRGPAEAMVATVRVEFDLTPEFVAVLYAYHFMWKHDGEGDDVRLLDTFRNDSATGIGKAVRASLRDMGGSDYIYMYVYERMPSEAISTLADMVVDRFIDTDTITRLFGEDAA